MVVRGAQVTVFALVAAVGVVVLDVLGEDGEELPFASDQDPVGELAAADPMNRSAIAFMRGVAALSASRRCRSRRTPRRRRR